MAITPRRRSASASSLPYLDLPPVEAAPRLGLSCEALWARLRRTEPINGRVPLGGGVEAYRFGRRAWRVRFPLWLGE